jgi:hypothetical protein
MATNSSLGSRSEHLFGLPVWLSCLAFAFSLASYALDQPPPDPQQEIRFDSRGGDILHGLLRLASERHLAMGMVLETSGKLCDRPRSSHFDDATLAEVIDGLLAGSGNKWFLRNGALEVRPNHVAEPETRILDMRFDVFNGMNTTIQGLGVILAGYVQSRLSGGGGIAGDILSSPDSEVIPPFTLRNVSVEQIADYIVSKGTKGAWLLYSPGSDGKHPPRFDLRTYGYKDDLGVLKRVTCRGMARDDN